MHHREVVRLDTFVDDFSETGIVPRLFRQEYHSHAVTSFFRDRDTVEQNELMRYLDHDAGTVSRLGISSFRPSMGHIFEYGEAFLDNVVILAAVYVHNKSDTTSIFLIFRRIQAFFKFVFHLLLMSLVTSLARPSSYFCRTASYCCFFSSESPAIFSFTVLTPLVTPALIFFLD